MKAVAIKGEGVRVRQITLLMKREIKMVIKMVIITIDKAIKINDD